ncbi:uncharacterized protein LOC111062618 isoform X2 [Nilaparvata lugens]|uniref:uncharacterized protein LOC111062618 isoform X2 n=1 Tax=Nilaparvata lugens TaxID=108931 RepID=UPI00193E0D2C|nr:uncharacterized protein LOC111062618 isoform X2 [Nilaparvata lugens]
MSSRELLRRSILEVSPIIGRRDTNMRLALSSRVKLQITLRFLALGYTYSRLEDIYSVPRSSISHFIKEVLDAMSEVLADYGPIQAHQNLAHWKKIQEEFMLKWQFPFCCGALGGKHVYIKNPPPGGSENFKYEGTFSIVMLALVDANYKFIYIDVGKNGRTNDASIFESSSLDDLLSNNTLNLPDKSILVASETFPLRKEVMTPFTGQHLTDKQVLFNHRLDRCQRTAENALGIMVSRFKVFQRPQNLALDKVDSIIRTCAVLHNWLLENSPNYIESGLIDEEDELTGTFTAGSWRSNPNSTGVADIQYPTSNSIHTQEAANYRQKLADYFLSDDARIQFE